MLLKALKIDIKGNEGFIILNSVDAERLGINVGEKILVKTDKRYATGVARPSHSMIKEGYAGLSTDLAAELGITDGEEKTVEIKRAEHGLSFEYIRKKFKGSKLSDRELYQIIKDISEGKTSDLEVLMFVFSTYYNGLDINEVISASKAMAETGNRIDLGEKVVDKHSIGGVPGNKVSLLIVPTFANSDFYIPKTSSKAITSPSGTADTMSVLANVDLEPSELIYVVKKTHGCIAWTGKLGISPADDKIIQIERPLRIDPEGLMIASVISKKIAMGVKYMVLDLPYGKGTKIEDEKYGMQLAQKFKDVGEAVGIKITSALTYGSQPVGHTVGPALEAKEALESLINPYGAPNSLLIKSASLAGLLFENVGLVEKGLGYDAALSLIFKGKSYQKLKEIIAAQGGNPDIKPDDLPVGHYTYDVTAEKDGYITFIDNNEINTLTRMLGAPYDKGAGIYIYKKENYKVAKGEPIIRLYSNSESKIDQSLYYISQKKPYKITGMLLESYP